MLIGKFMYIIGGFLNQLELAKSNVTVRERGLEGTGFQKMIGIMLENVRQIEV
jgi:hypothetical protein